MTLVGGWQTTGIVRWTSGFPFIVEQRCILADQLGYRGMGHSDLEDSIAGGGDVDR